MVRCNAIFTGILGSAMSVFGLLKFVDPFKSFYATQILKSEIPYPIITFWGGQFCEIFAGLVLIYILVSSSNSARKKTTYLFFLANITIIILMSAAFYVHMHVNVPIDVLPLKIRTPYVPVFFLVLAVLNIYFYPKNIGQLQNTSTLEDYI